MVHAPTAHFLNPKFDKFLQSYVGEDRGGDGITVLSMLARLGVDPWQEASELAAMSEASARQRLDALMARFTGVPFWVPSRNDVVLRLIAILPRGSFSSNSTLDGQPSQSLQKFLGTSLYIAVLIASLLTYYAFRAFGN